jgi:hypothetical protein
MPTTVYALPNAYSALTPLPSADLNLINNTAELVYVQLAELIGSGVRKTADFNATAVPATANVNLSPGVAICGASGGRKIVQSTGVVVVALTGATNYLWTDNTGAITITATNVAPSGTAVLLCYAEIAAGVSANVNNAPTGRVNLDSLLAASRDLPLTIANGGTAGTTAATARANLGFSRLAKALADADYAPTPTEYGNRILEFSGALTANRNITLPVIAGGEFLISNVTGGGFSLTVKVTGLIGVTVANGKRAYIYCNGTDYVRATPDT